MPEIFIWAIVIWIVVVLVFVAVLLRRGYRPKRGLSGFGPSSDSTDSGPSGT